jgi:hypothetical protein
MKTSWKNTQRLDNYLQQQLKPEEVLLLEAHLVLEPELQDALRWQRRTHALVRAYGRQQLRREIQSAQQKVFHRPEHRGFRQTILRIFSKR